MNTTDIPDAMALLMWHAEHSGTETVIEQIETWLSEPDSEGQPWHNFLATGVQNAVRQAHLLQSGLTVISIRYPTDGFEVTFEFKASDGGNSEYRETVLAAVEHALTGGETR